MSIFNLDSPFMVFMTKVANLMILNILTLALCIPVVTGGAAVTAMYYVTLKMVKGEESYIVKGYFKSFRQNFKQSTIMWLILLAVSALLGLDMFLLSAVIQVSYAKILLIIVFIISVFAVFTSLYMFPLLARFDNTIKNTVKNAFLMSLMNLPRTILILLIHLLPFLLVLLSLSMMPLVFVLGFSSVAYFSSMLFGRIFSKFEPEEEVDDGEYKPLSFMVEEAEAKAAALREKKNAEEEKKED